MDFLECSNISLETKGFLVPGKIKLTHEQIIFKDNKTRKTTKIQKANIDEIVIHQTTDNYLIRVSEKDKKCYRFVGFTTSQKDKLQEFLSNVYDLKVKIKELSTCGWNWGKAKFKGSSLSFKVNKKNAFEIPLENVSQCVATKNEVTLEFHQNEENAVDLTEIRFFIPSCHSNDDLIDSFRKRVLSQATISNEFGDVILTFPEVQTVTPRGRYDIKIFHYFIQLHGKSFDFKVPTSSIVRLFMLPHKDLRQMYFIINLNPPIRQGQTRYHFLVFIFNKEDTIAVELPFTDKKISELYGDKLTKNMEGPLYEMVAKITKVIVDKKITGPSDFIGHSETSLVLCSYKTAAGYLYPLEKGLLYLYKPTLYISFDEILLVNFARGETLTRSFDFEIELQSGSKYVFSNINKEEYNAIFEYLTKKNVTVKNKVKFFVKDNVDVTDDEFESYFGQVENDEQEDKDEVSSDDNFNPLGEESSDDESSLNSSLNESDNSFCPTSTKSQKMKKSKKVIDKNKPKRPQTAFMLWLNENREKIKSKNPDMKVTEIAKEGGRLWKEMTDKTKWEKKAKEAKKDYEEAMKEYKAKTEDD